jgi:3-dehydroquinate synthase
VSEYLLPLANQSVPVSFADEGVEWCGEQIAGLLRERSRLVIIADARVDLLYGKELLNALAANGFEVSTATFEPGEDHKTLRTASTLLDQMAERALARDDVVIGLGGGVSTDVAGFCASVYNRGIRWIAVPTSLLGMVDAAIGGKTGVDHPLAKNLIGTFHQPLAVIAPLMTLETLPVREWTCGSAEVVKVGLLAGGTLWKTIEQHGPDLKEWPRDLARKVIPQSAGVKLEIVARDEREHDVRWLLNLGHTFGHALETVTGYRTFLHGEAVFLGLRAAVALSHAQGLLSAQDSTQIDDVLSRVPLPRADVLSDALIAALAHDKKTRAGKLHWVLLKQLGQPMVTSDVSPVAVRKVADWVCEIASRGVPVDNCGRMRILVLNGPNLNLLGEREPAIYGDTSYAELEELICRHAAERNIEILIRQSNLEGELISLIQQARHWANGIVLNPGSYSHTSVGIRDALSAVTLPAIEVHLSDISKREDFRRVSLTAPACRALISGKGVAGYLEAMEQLSALIEGNSNKDHE